MLFDRKGGAPPEISRFGLSAWHAGLSDIDKAKAARYAGGGPSSRSEFAVSFMRRANEDHNFSISASLGSHLLGALAGMERFRLIEELVVARFGMGDYAGCLEACDAGLEMIGEVLGELKAESGGEVPERLCCRNYKINALVGAMHDYDGGDAALDGFVSMGILSAEDAEFRKRSHRIYRLQRSFDGIYSLRPKDGDS
ncbi:MAG: hypothetical protein LBG62_06240 [Candidatus Methanoplasma sp.]|jgi:hypothetical protein|nr:hypothetical protein [Candidatus Methanoplasma sp.]